MHFGSSVVLVKRVGLPTEPFLHHPSEHAPLPPLPDVLPNLTAPREMTDGRLVASFLPAAEQ